MELSVMNKEEKKHPAFGKLAEKPQERAGPTSSPAEPGERAIPCRFDANARITEAMMWHSPDTPTRKKPHKVGPDIGPTWGHLRRRIIVGGIEILIPLAFILGMIYWRAPWLFWAAVHFLRGEPILNF